jgi:protein TonB
LDAYAQSLSALLARQRSYPSVAAMRGWEGEVRLVLRIARRGGLIEVQVQHSSGYDVLDRNAVQLVQQAAPLPQPPEGLAGSEFQVSVPIQYRLRKSS